MKMELYSLIIKTIKKTVKTFQVSEFQVDDLFIINKGAGGAMSSTALEPFTGCNEV